MVVGEVTLDLGQMMKKKDQSVGGLTKGIEFLFKKNKVEYIKGHGRFTGPNDIAVDLADRISPFVYIDTTKFNDYDLLVPVYSFVDPFRVEVWLGHLGGELGFEVVGDARYVSAHSWPTKEIGR